MEAANVLLVPGLALWLGRPNLPLEIIAFALAAIAAAGLLIVGACYWFAVDRALRRRERHTMQRALQLAHRAQRPALVAATAAAIATLAALSAHGWSAGVIAAVALSVLAALEYVNYYHRQLQHFDNLADLKRLLTRWELRPAHMARDLAAYRRKRA
jgi:hypothetical protein